MTISFPQKNPPLIYHDLKKNKPGPEKTANEAALVLRSTSRGDESFSRSCTDGENCITVNGIAPVTLKFGGSGDDAAMFAALSEAGAFEGTTSHKIFEESKSLLA